MPFAGTQMDLEIGILNEVGQTEKGKYHMIVLVFMFAHVCVRVCVCLVAQLCLTLCNAMDCSPPGSVHGIFQARILKWVAIFYSRGSSQPKDQTCTSCNCRWVLFQLCHLGSPNIAYMWNLF